MWPALKDRRGMFVNKLSEAWRNWHQGSPQEKFGIEYLNSFIEKRLILRISNLEIWRASASIYNRFLDSYLQYFYQVDVQPHSLRWRLSNSHFLDHTVSILGYHKQALSLFLCSSTVQSRIYLPLSISSDIGRQLGSKPSQVTEKSLCPQLVL